MNAEPDFTAADTDRPLLPPEPAGRGWRHWAIAAAALLLLAGGAYRAYQWLLADVSQRRAAASAPAPAPAPAATGVPAAPPPPVGRTVRPPQPSAVRGAEPRPPAVAGGVSKCVLDGQISYTQGPCPAGTEVPPGGAAPEPAAPARPVPLEADGPSQRAAACGYLTAEIARLDYEFHQPLPPPVVDHVSSQLRELRARAAALRCAVPVRADAPSPAAAPAGRRPPSRVAEEKSGG